MPDMTTVAAIGVTHWHALYDAAYLVMLKELPDVNLVAIHDDDASIAAERAAKLGNPPIYTDYKKMLAEVKPDFVVALGRPIDMAAIAHYLLDHGIPFVMEKPMGYNAEEVRSVADKARDKGGFAAVPLPYRYQPQILLAQKLIAEGCLGPLSHISFRSMRPTSARYSAWGAPWMLDPKIANGGCLRNLGPHGIDAFMLLTGEDAEVTGAQVSQRGLNTAVEDYACVLLRSASGVVGIVEVSNLSPNMAGKADLLVSGGNSMLVVEGSTARIITDEGTQTIQLEAGRKPSLLILRDALAHARAGKPPLTSVENCYRVVRLIDRAYALARG
ncbi:MAG: Gfo/Idh/MocA family oxidoreductase [Betaproteobacteria bacterium]|nr:Gfo/Idh/MocA family oxidoreductase [Betaproteobacteria bacterium]